MSPRAGSNNRKRDTDSPFRDLGINIEMLYNVSLARVRPSPFCRRPASGPFVQRKPSVVVDGGGPPNFAPIDRLDDWTVDTIPSPQMNMFCTAESPYLGPRLSRLMGGSRFWKWPTFTALSYFHLFLALRPFQRWLQQRPTYARPARLHNCLPVRPSDSCAFCHRSRTSIGIVLVRRISMKQLRRRRRRSRKYLTVIFSALVQPWTTAQELEEDEKIRNSFVFLTWKRPVIHTFPWFEVEFGDARTMTCCVLRFIKFFDFPIRFFVLLIIYLFYFYLYFASFSDSQFFFSNFHRFLCSCFYLD